MASTAAPAPWRKDFLDHLTNNMDSPEFVLSTIHPAMPGTWAANSSTSGIAYVPHARFCIFRGMWGQLPENKHNDAPRNPALYESDMPTFTSDVRMEKVPEIMGTSKGASSFETGKSEDGKSLHGGSGGGGPVEAVWWVKDVMVQWRIKGEAFVVGPDVEGEGNDGASGIRTLKREAMKRMRLVGGEEGQKRKGEWSWKRELTGHFGNQSPGLRGSFKQPPPGQPKDKPYDEENEHMGEKVTSLDDPVARKNFRVVIIRPEEVEMLDLKPESARRERYTYVPESDSWEQVTTWP